MLHRTDGNPSSLEEAEVQLQKIRQDIARMAKCLDSVEDSHLYELALRWKGELSNGRSNGTDLCKLVAEECKNTWRQHRLPNF